MKNDCINSYYDEGWESKICGEKNNVVRFLLFVLLYGKEFGYDESKILCYSDYGVVNLYGI